MSFSILDKFKSLFMDQQPKDYHLWEEQRDVGKVSAKVQKGGEFLRELRGGSVIQPLMGFRKEIDQLQFTVLHMIPRWQQTEAGEVRKAIEGVRKQVEDISVRMADVHEQILKKSDSEQSDDQREQFDQAYVDIQGIRKTLRDELAALDDRKDLKIGEGSDFVDHGLKQGWVPDGEGKGGGTFQYQSEEEWENLKKRGVKQDLEPTAIPMKVVSEGANKVHLRDGQDLNKAQQRLGKERETSEKLRKDMNDTIKKRLKTDGPVAQGIVNNSDFAKKLAGLLKDPSIKPEDLLKDHPTGRINDKGEDIKEDGILKRIIGNIDGQGQFSKDDPTEVADGIEAISERIVKGDKLENEDANKIQQFISCFVDGLTEVNEKNKSAQDQFELLWPKLEKAFDLKEADKARLMERVQVYKKLAGGLADTEGSGKGTRKKFTREGKMTEGKNTIDDPEALIANDISGSMHSQFLAMEIAETLSGKMKDEKDNLIPPGFKSAGESVQIKEKDVLDARMIDALTMTAGGKHKGGKLDGKDRVMHTAYEMINGSQAITGLANKVSQATATEVMELLKDGKSFSQAMEEALPDEVFPWQLDSAATVNKRATSALEKASKEPVKQANTTADDPVFAAVKKLVDDVLWMATDLDGPSKDDVLKIREALEKKTEFTVALKDHFKQASFNWK